MNTLCSILQLNFDHLYSSSIPGITKEPEFIQTLERLNRHHIAFLVSYDGRRGTTSFGEQLPSHLRLKRIELEAGRSSQATLLGRHEVTIESLYLSPSLVQRLSNLPISSYIKPKSHPEQLVLLEPYGHSITVTG